VTRPRVLVAVIACPRCGTEFEGAWAEPDDPGTDAPEPALQLCPERGCVFEADYPGYSFHTEAG
jgi:hypothetical protein